MSLLDEYMAETGKCQLLDRTSRSDGRGGIVYVYTPGAEFEAAIFMENSLETEQAEKQGVTGLYQVTVKKPMRLEYHTVFKRLSDGKTFRITSKDASTPPNSSTLNMRVVRAEEYEIKSDGE